MRRDNLTWTSQLKISERQQLTASLLFTDMYYQTPGALTAAEFAANPRAARPAGGGFPSAVAINAAIYQKTILAGFNNQYQISHSFKNSTSLYGAFAQIKNSAIRNYERRNEPQFGGRSSFIYTSKLGEAGLQLVGGGEFQQGYNNTQVAENLNGNPDTLQTNDDVTYTTYSLFLQGDLNINDKWLATVGVSINKSKVGFKRLSVFPVLNQERKYQNELMPRVSVLRKFGNDLSLLATFSTGFSPPAIRELLPSTGVISTNLEAEKGINYEMTARYQVRQFKLFFEATAFYFKVKDALVQQRDLSGADFFTNAGDVKQKGIELHTDYTYSPAGKIIDNIILQVDYTYSHFRYGQYVKDNNDFSGNEVPSVPGNTVSAMADITLKNGLYLNGTFYSASRIFLNDANTFSAKPYEVLGARIGWKTSIKHYRINFYLGGDNLLNEVYSLGNDINAAANRFYNAAPGRNYYVGLALQCVGKKAK
jgi:iron complex outermembrane receptor protein